MNNFYLTGLAFLKVSILLIIGGVSCAPEVDPAVDDEPVVNEADNNAVNELVELPDPIIDDQTVSGALYERVSRRDYTGDSLDLAAAGELLWAAGGVNVDGVTGATRTAPSAGGTYALDHYLVAGNVEDLEAGIYRYNHEQHTLEKVTSGDKRSELASAALDQQFIADAPLNVVMAAYYERTTATYGERGERYVHMETGYASQNVHLIAEELNLGTVAIGAFEDELVAEILETDGEPLMIMPVGVPVE